MTDFGLPQRTIDELIAYFKSKPFIEKVCIFGSRAKGTYKEYSDIDIAVDLNNKKLDTDILGRILIEFQDSTLPYEVDVIDINSIDEKFKNLIQDSLVELK